MPYGKHLRTLWNEETCCASWRAKSCGCVISLPTQVLKWNLIWFFNCFSVVQLSERFGCDLPSDELADEYSDYQLSPDNNLPKFTDGDRLDEFWLAMEELKVSSGEKLFRYLPVVALSALSLPHSNADPERSFSMVRKIQTDQRDSLLITYTYF